MKEFIEKLIGRLEEYQDKYAFIASEDDYALGEINACVYIINIINELAEEYINTSTDTSSDTSTDTSSGWIEKLLEAKGNCSEDSYCSECPFGQIEDRCILAELQIKGGNNGWIPCSEKLPEDGVDVLVWFEYYRYGAYDRLFQTTGISFTYNGKWSGFVNGSSGWSQLSIIAWQPLPEPFKEVQP